jgi:hypothetical protein
MSDEKWRIGRKHAAAAVILGLLAGLTSQNPLIAVPAGIVVWFIIIGLLKFGYTAAKSGLSRLRTNIASE